jgi:hypothetical protein
LVGDFLIVVKPKNRGPGALERESDPICVDRPRGFTLAPMTVYETTNHQTIYHWATARGLWPACVAGSPDRIRLGGDEFAPEQEELEPIEWWRWFQEFDRRLLQLVYDPSKGWFTLASRLPPQGA